MLNLTGDIYLLGDIHGDFRATFRDIESNDITDSTIICVGDLGAGFLNYDEAWLKMNARKFDERGIKFLSIRGNHDNPAFFKGQTYMDCFTLLRDYTYADVNGEIWLFVGGAKSVDRIDRVPGFSYWEDEGFNLQIAKVTPCDVLITHSGPNWVGPVGQNALVSYYVKKEGPQLWKELCDERDTFDTLYSVAQPKRAYLGHFHESSSATHKGCKARILNIDELILYRQ